MSVHHVSHLVLKFLFAFLIGISTVKSQLSLDPYCNNNRPVLSVLPETCCSIPNFFDDNTLARCKNVHGTESLSRDENSRKKRYATTRMELGTCYLDCVFQLYGITVLNRQGFDSNKLLRILAMETPSDVESTNLIASSMSQCIIELNTGLLKVRAPTLYNCSTIPSALMMCIHRKFFQNCPSTRFANIQQCVQLRDYLTRCPVNI